MKKNERLTLNSDLLRTFVVIAECGNLTHAADQLHRTQSAVSVKLRRLEEDLKVSLFERHARGMTLSQNGEKLLPIARRALAEIHRAGTLFDAPLRGSIRVGIPDDFDDTILERSLAEFAKRNPDVEVIAWSGCTSKFADAIRKNDLDLAVCSGPDEVAGEVFSSEATIWASSKTLILDEAAPVPLAVLDRKCWWRDMPAEALERHGRNWKVTYKSGSFSSVRAAIRAGFAVGALPINCLESGMQILSKKDGFPPLPSAKRALLIRSGAPEGLTSAMADAIRDAALKQQR